MANTARRDKGPQPIEDLRWFWQDSDVELGIEAQQLRDNPGPPDAHAPPGPTGKEIKTAERQAQIIRVLNKLTGTQQAGLRACYEFRAVPPGVIVEWGTAAGAIYRAQESHNRRKEELRQEVLASGAACKAAERLWETVQRRAWAMVEAPSVAGRAKACAQAARAWKRTMGAAAAHKAGRRAVREHEEQFEGVRDKNGEVKVKGVQDRVLELVNDAHDGYRRHRQAQRADEQQYRQDQAETAEARRITVLEESRTRKRKRGFSSKTQDRINAVAKMVMDMLSGAAA